MRIFNEISFSIKICNQKERLVIKNSHVGGLEDQTDKHIRRKHTFSNNLDASLCKIFLSSTWPPTRWTSSQALNRNEMIYREGIDGRDIFISDWFSSDWSCLTTISSHPCSGKQKMSKPSRLKAIRSWLVYHQQKVPIHFDDTYYPSKRQTK